ncbi:dTDP-4-dehydrorhamnose 3,5-epimerase family protein [Rhizobium sp. TH2]|uniref:dTDP-4-dehydrorhamnose 3,5-epimerase family protein n=1 Tax=Rhizobium sp. TH2 TaxID=2775403 RepID=UPI002157D38C|nr:dTDP-4-dehydrorhamnose 3,5-epimerase family protein [Rhizobium sp. TH2]UVC07544.1 dTDP-4-dehydrorhamnose 3,5-epimerase family protein [Rhizobium sp. TH2]
MTRFETIDTSLSGLKLLRRKRFGDHRGYLTRLYDAEELTEIGWTGGIHQINETGTAERGTVRGFHYQTPPFSEAKLIACTRGKILDVAVDIRRGSPTFLRHFAAELSEENDLSFLLPEGFAHGYQALTSDVRMIYAHSAPYRAEAEAGLNIADERLGVTWPLPVANLSTRDQGFAMLTDEFTGVSP